MNVEIAAGTVNAFLKQAGLKKADGQIRGDLRT
jgi:hypothetical protein